MYTQCPHCQTIFGVNETHLSAAFGRVRCGQCHGQFNAKQHLIEELPSPSEDSHNSPAAEKSIEIALTDALEELEVIDIGQAEVPPPPEEDTEYIDLSSSEETSLETQDEEEEIIIELDDEIEMTEQQNPEPEEIIVVSDDIPEPGLPETRPPSDTGREELNAIFADLDLRLERLSDSHTDPEDPVFKPDETFEAGNIDFNQYKDDFGDPNNQTEDDIKASIETIFAAAEAELIKTDVADESEIEKLELDDDDDGFLDSQDAFTIETDDSDESGTEGSVEPLLQEQVLTEDFDLASEPEQGQQNDDEAVIDEKQDGMIVQPATPLDIYAQPSFEQEELPLALHADDTADTKPKRSYAMVAILLLSSLVLSLALVFQLAMFRNVELANKLPILKPHLVRFCQAMPCQFVGRRDSRQIILTSRDVRSHPGGKNTILINAIFVNKAEFEQPYSDILLTLSDLTTTVLAQRRFSPSDYLNKQTGIFQLMKPGRPVHISLEVLDPGNDAVNFQFEFL